MPVQELVNFRAKYPDYGDMDDATLASKLAVKYPDAYGDLPDKVKMVTPQPQTPQQAPTTPEEPAPLPDEMSPQTYEPTQSLERFGEHARQAYGTMQNVGRVYPALETAAQIGTSMYGLPAAGLAGLASLPRGLDKAAGVVGAVQDALIYKPQTQRGQELAETANYPVTKLGEAGEAAGGALEQAGYPNLGAAAHTLIQAGPLTYTLGRMGGRAVLSPLKPSLDAKIAGAVREGMDKAVRPTVSGKGTAPLVEKYYEKATTAVQDVVEHSQGKLPQTVEEFSQAISETKKGLHEKWSQMSQDAGGKGATVNLGPTRAELQGIIDQKNIPQSVKNAAQKALSEISSYDDAISPAIAEDLLANLNTQTKTFWRAPNPNDVHYSAMAERMTRNIREATNKAVEQYEGPGWQEYRNRYGAQLAIEKEVTNRATVWGRRSPSGFFDITNAFSAGEFVRGLLTLDPSKVAAAAAMHGAKWYNKFRANPDRIVKNMFENVDKLMKQKEPLPYQGGETETMGPPEEPPPSYEFQQREFNPGPLKAPKPETVESMLRRLRK